MDEDYDHDIARDLCQHPRFTWVDGMLTERGTRADHRTSDCAVLSDMATAGGVLSLVDGQGVLTDVVRDADGWIVAVDLPSGLKGFASDHLGEAAAWALMEAWAELSAMGDA